MSALPTPIPQSENPPTDDIGPTRRERTQPPQVIVQRTGIPEAIVAAFSALGFALSARMILFVSLVGAFVLAVMAMLSPSLMTLSVMIAYCALTVVPAVVLEIFAKRPEG